MAVTRDAVLVLRVPQGETSHPVTEIGDRSERSIRRAWNAHERYTGYEWTFPLCGNSPLNSGGGEDREENAIAVLQSHILASDSDGHGPRNELPARETLTLSDHVSRVDERH